MVCSSEQRVTGSATALGSRKSKPISLSGEPFILANEVLSSSRRISGDLYAIQRMSAESVTACTGTEGCIRWSCPVNASMLCLHRLTTLDQAFTRAPSPNTPAKLSTILLAMSRCCWCPSGVSCPPFPLAFFHTLPSCFFNRFPAAVRLLSSSKCRSTHSYRLSAGSHLEP